jgi:hypothetical protein
MDHNTSRVSPRHRARAFAAMTAISPVAAVVTVALASGALFIGGHRPPAPSTHLVSTQISIGSAGVSLHLIIR